MQQATGLQNIQGCSYVIQPLCQSMLHPMSLPQYSDKPYKKPANVVQSF